MKLIVACTVGGLIASVAPVLAQDEGIRLQEAEASIERQFDAEWASEPSHADSDNKIAVNASADIRAVATQMKVGTEDCRDAEMSPTDLLVMQKSTDLIRTLTTLERGEISHFQQLKSQYDDSDDNIQKLTIWSALMSSKARLAMLQTVSPPLSTETNSLTVFVGIACIAHRIEIAKPATRNEAFMIHSLELVSLYEGMFLKDEVRKYEITFDYISSVDL